MIFRKYLLVATLFLVAAAPLARAQTPKAVLDAVGLEEKDLKRQGVLFPYILLDYVLGAHVNKGGNVDYDSLRKSQRDSQLLSLFVEAVGKADRAQFPVFSSKVTDPKDGKEKMMDDRSPETAFLINAYNALVLKSLADAFPIGSPDDIKGFYSDKTRLVAGKMYSLEALRMEIAQRDSRAVFALCDGTQGGPMLAASAYRFAALNEWLNTMARVFVNDPRNVQVNRLNKEAVVSSYLKPFDALFRDKGSRSDSEGVREILGAYLSEKAESKYAITGGFAIKYAPMDRSLNRPRT